MIEVDLVIPKALSAEALARAPQVFDTEIRKTIAGDLLLLEGDIVRATPVGVTGNLRGATATEVRGTGMDIRGRIYNPSMYAAAVEDGSRPHTPPMAPILRWAARKGLGAKVGRAVWAAIVQAGTKAHPYWWTSIKARQAELTRRHAALLTRMRVVLGGKA